MEQPQQTNLSVLVLDDEESMRFSFERFLKAAGYEVNTAPDLQSARALLNAREYSVAVVDRILTNNESGLDIIKELETLNPFCQPILISGFPSFESAAETIRYRTFAYLTKPVTRDELCATVDAAAHASLGKKQEHVHQALFRSLFESLPNPVLICDLEGRALFTNPAFAGVFGFPDQDITGRTVPFVPENDTEFTREVFTQVIQGKRVPERETMRLTRDGRLLHVTTSFSLCLDSRGEPSHVLEILRDITERKMMEQELIQAEKMSVLGQLSARLAHEINNPVQVISGYTELLMENQAIGSQVKSSVELIHEAAMTIKRLNADLMEVARPKPIVSSRFRPEEPLEKAINFLAEMGEIKYCRIEKQFDPAAPIISGDGEQLRQVFINLIMNASHALEDREGKMIVFATRYHPESGQVAISVHDNGCGIAPEHMQDIFSPFYTSRPDRGGTGLGLAIIKSIVERHGGTISASSTGQAGTTFTITLPAPRQTN